MAARYVRISKAAEETGYTQRAIETKIDRGVWIEGREYRRAPDGHILIDMEGYNRWVEHREESSFTAGRSGSTSGMRAN